MARWKVWGLMPVLAILTQLTTADDEYQFPSNARQRSRRAAYSGTTLDVTSVIHPPYLMRVENSEDYEGFIKDILDELTDRTGIEFRIHMSPSLEDPSSDVGWNASAMIEELVRRQDNPSSPGLQADIAAAAISMTSSRREQVDFIYPFQDMGFTILSQKALRVDQTSLGIVRSSFNILAPIDVGVWAVFFLAVLVVSGLLFLINLRSPYEWRGRHRIGQASEEEGATLSLLGALWFIITTMQWQGFERGPRSVGGRVLSAFWFMFVTVTLVTYTAAVTSNLFWTSAVHMDNPRALPYQDLFDLIKDTNYQIGCVSNGSTYRYLMAAQGMEYTALQRRLRVEDDGGGIVGSVEEGLARLRADKYYAFIMESAEAEYIVNQRPCDLVTVGGVFSKRAFAWPHRKDLSSEVTDALHVAMMELTELGTIEALEQRWFRSGSCWNVTKFEKATRMSTLMLNKPKSVDMGMFWGPVLMLIVGILISILASFVEAIYYMYKGRYDPRNRPGGRKLALEEDND